MEPGVWPGLADAPAAPVVGGVIVRRELFECLDNAGRVTEVSAPAGSGKTVLLRSWIGQPGLVGRAAWVPVPDGGYDPQRFWTAVADALRGTAAVSTLVRPLTPAPDLDGWAIVERLLKDLMQLAERVWLVIDDVHELASDEALRQLELLLLRAPPELRFVLATRHELPLGLHRLRLEGELTEIRAGDRRLPWQRRGRCSRRQGCGCRTPRSRSYTRGRKDGRQAYAWRHSRCPATRTRSGSPRSSPAASARWPAT
jgi:LuxR family transcriptional regulator, maltose regulon positive regulatory protein